MEPNNSPRSLGVFMLRLPAPAVILWLLFLYYNSKPPFIFFVKYFFFFWQALSERRNSKSWKHTWWMKRVRSDSDNQPPYASVHFTFGGWVACVCVCVWNVEPLTHSTIHYSKRFTSNQWKGQSQYWTVSRVKPSGWSAATRRGRDLFVQASK